MIDFVNEVETIATKYGLKMSCLDATDVTMMVRIEIVPTIFIQVYRNRKKNKLNMTLVLGNNRIYGVDSEGNILHEHPIQNPLSHIPLDYKIGIEEFVVKSLRFLQKMDIL